MKKNGIGISVAANERRNGGIVKAAENGEGK